MEPFKENRDLAAGKSEQEVNLLEGEETFKCSTAPVPKTGQTTKWSVGDDGDLEKGVAWSVPRFRDNANGTVTDDLTGLIWLKNANCAGSSNSNDGKTTWEKAFGWVKELNQSGTMNGQPSGDKSNGGSHQTDWRLPNVKELQSLVHYGFSNPALSNADGDKKWKEGDLFDNVKYGSSDRYWSSTAFSDGTSYGWYVNLHYGVVRNHFRTSHHYYVWPVRGGQ